jgi:molybdate transport system substrate-binding protein
MKEIGDQYKKTAPNVTLTFVFDSSGTLQTQIEEGAPADIFFSAAQKQMNALEEKNLILKGTRRDLLKNKVVLIKPNDSALDITTFEDVATDKVSLVAIGEESVPVGQYTQDIYTYLGTWEQIQAKANLGSNVRAVLTWVESGDVDCGIVYATDAASSDGVKVIAEAPEGSHTPVIYPGAVVSASKNQTAAKAFLDYLSGADAVKSFENAGFTVVK